MTDRATLRTGFLTQCRWEMATHKPLAGDASNRTYERLTQGETAAVLMDAPPKKGETVAPFVLIANFLRRQGLSAPTIIAHDIENGFLLIEDLGDDLFARLMARDIAMEMPLYLAAVDVLLHLHTTPPPDGLAAYSVQMMSDLAALAVDWYANEGPSDPQNATRQRVESAISALLQTHAGDYPVLIQRDYHSENLLWLPDRIGVARVGLLDFQDAMAGHPAYDLASLLTDARRDVSPDVQTAALDYFIARSGVPRDAFLASYVALGLQRNLRILGVFSRLSLHHNKPQYIDLIPRVWGHILALLEHPALATVKPLIVGSLPPPDAKKLLGLKKKCGTIPTR